MENLSENILCAIIGVGGTVIGTIVGFLLPTVGKSFGRKALTITDIEASWDTGELDEIGCYHGSRLDFTVTVLNKKGKSLILENPTCELYGGSQLLGVYACDDNETRKSIAHSSVYESMMYLDIPPKSSVRKQIHVPVSGNLTSCDKVVFLYSWGIVKRKKTIWVKEDVTHANS